MGSMEPAGWLQAPPLPPFSSDDGMGAVIIPLEFEGIRFDFSERHRDKDRQMGVIFSKRTVVRKSKPQTKQLIQKNISEHQHNNEDIAWTVGLSVTDSFEKLVDDNLFILLRISFSVVHDGGILLFISMSCLSFYVVMLFLELMSTWLTWCWGVFVCQLPV